MHPSSSLSELVCLNTTVLHRNKFLSIIWSRLGVCWLLIGRSTLQPFNQRSARLVAAVLAAAVDACWMQARNGFGGVGGIEAMYVRVAGLP